MAVGYLNERTQKVINMMSKRSSALSIKEMANELGVSTRTVYNELDRANDWLKMKELPCLQVVRGHVQPFSAEETARIESIVGLEKSQDDYIFTPSERTKIIICQIISSGNAVYVEELMKSCQVSRNTIFADLQAVIAQLYSYKLELGYEKKRGYWIDGDAIHVRAIFFLYFNMLEPLFEMGKISFLNMEEVEENLKRLEQIEAVLKVKYVRNDMLALAAMIPIMERGYDQLYFSDLDIKKVQSAKEYHFVQEYFPELSETEKIYLTLHFLGGRLSSYSSNDSDSEKNETIMEIARNLVVEFERKACVVFSQKDKLIQELYRHIEASIYRYRFGIQIGNTLAEAVKREYPYIFDVTRSAVRYMEQQIRAQISDSEVAYLVMHFGAHLEYAEHDEKELRILVVCINGMATGNMISHELKRLLPQAKIVGVHAAADIVNPQNMCDIIVSSVKMKTVVPVIVVNPILNDFDRKNILNHPLIRSKIGFVDMDALFQVVKKYVLPEKYKELRYDLERFFVKSSEEKQPILSPDVWRLTDFLTEDRIVFLESNGRKRGEKTGKYALPDHLKDWERALYTTAFPLIERKSIDENYVQCIIKRLVESGPYMFVTKDLVLAHARPENGVKHLDLAIGIAPEGVTFAEGKKARIIFLLVVEDQQKHMGILRDIRKALAKSPQIDVLAATEDAKEVCDILRGRLNNDSEEIKS